MKRQNKVQIIILVIKCEYQNIEIWRGLCNVCHKFHIDIDMQIKLKRGIYAMS